MVFFALSTSFVPGFASGTNPSENASGTNARGANASGRLWGKGKKSPGER